VTHADPYLYYTQLAVTKPWHRDERLGCWVACGAETVTAVLSSDLCRVRPADEPVPPALLGSPAAEIFRQLVRMTDGAGHYPLKRAVSLTLDGLDERRVAETAAEWADYLADECVRAIRFGFGRAASGAARVADAAAGRGRATHARSPMSSGLAVAGGARRLAATSDGCGRGDGGGGADGFALDRISAFGFRLSAFVIASLLGVPRDRLPQVAALMQDFARCIAPGCTHDEVARGVAASGPLLDLFRAMVKDEIRAMVDDERPCGEPRWPLRARSARKSRHADDVAADGVEMVSRDSKADSLLARLAREARRAGIDANDATDVIAANGIGFMSQAYEATAGLIGNTVVALASRADLRAQLLGAAGVGARRAGANAVDEHAGEAVVEEPHSRAASREADRCDADTRDTDVRDTDARDASPDDARRSPPQPVERADGPTILRAAQHLRAVIQEVLRYDPPVHNTRRFVSRDGVIAGQPVRAGDVILVVLAAANRDPLANPHPEHFDPFRPSRRRFTFGAAQHACPGERLATAITEAAVRSLLAHNLVPASLTEPPRYRPSVNTRIPFFADPPAPDAGHPARMPAPARAPSAAPVTATTLASAPATAPATPTTTAATTAATTTQGRLRRVPRGARS
jgi:cytochrome P450